jgi:hypothetical protein
MSLLGSNADALAKSLTDRVAGITPEMIPAILTEVEAVLPQIFKDAADIDALAIEGKATLLKLNETLVAANGLISTGQALLDKIAGALK